nr:ribonuclease H-like domain-containing protein [Tanacetum cinerariifolium]
MKLCSHLPLSFNPTPLPKLNFFLPVKTPKSLFTKTVNKSQLCHCTSTPSSSQELVVNDGGGGGRGGDNGGGWNGKYNDDKGQFGNLVQEYGWQVRKMDDEDNERRIVANIQAEAFYEPTFLFNDVFFQFFKAEVLSGLLYRLRNSPPDSGCSRHMTGNIYYLFDFEPFDGGYVSFGQGGCKITGKGTIKTECIMLGRNFKLLDDTNIFLRTPRQHNMYTIDLNNIVPHKDLTCLVAKASADECIIWHKRLGHLNVKTMNKLVRYNLVRGLPTKSFDNDHTCTACLKGKQHKAFCKSKLVNSKKREATARKIALLSKSRRNCQSKSNDSFTKSANTQFRRVFVVSQGESLSIHITFSFHTHQKIDQQYATVAKIPILDTGKFEKWQFRIQQYLQHEHYALWEVIEFEDSYEVPASATITDTTSGETGKKSGRIVTVTAEDMQKKKNDVKARTTLLLSLPDEHQLRFSKYKTTRELWAAILETVGGNEATKKTKKNLLKQQYRNFKAECSETLEQTFNRLQVIVGQLQFMDVVIEQDDLNQQFLTSLAPEWFMHTIVWRNISDLDTMSLYDLYNHLKVYESKVQKKSEPNSQNIAFISSAKHSSGNEDGNTTCVPTASTNVPIASASVATISQDTACAYIASQSSDVAGFNKSKVECFNCHKMGHFARECRAPRSQDRGRRDNYRQGSKAEEQAPKALMAIDGVGWDRSYTANDGEDHALVADEEAPTEFALMANTSTENKKLETLKKEKEWVDGKLAGLLIASKDLNNLIESQRADKNKNGLEYSVVPPPPAQIYSSPKKDLSWTGLPEFADDTVTDYSRPSPTMESSS